MHYKYHLTVIHGKSEYSYKGPVISLMRSSNEVNIPLVIVLVIIVLVVIILVVIILVVIILLFSAKEVISVQIRMIMWIGCEDAFLKWRDI